MADTFKRKYGLDWPISYHDIFIDMVCAKKWREKPYCLASLDDPGTHLLRAARALLSPKDFTISRWTEEHAEDWTTTNFCITWGSAACSKSNDYGLFAVLDWATDPTETVTLMGSTDIQALQRRSYESVIRYFQLLKRNPHFLFPGKESRTTKAIVNVESEGDEDGPLSTVKASIRGVAVNDGGSLQGAHLSYVRLILDELSEMKPHGMNARANLSIGCRDFKCFGLCNPTSLWDEGARYSVPLDGWASVTADTEVWPTRWGRVRHHNGFKSPAIVEPDGAAKYPYLINQEQIDRRLKEEDGNADARDIWVFVRGFPPRSGIDDTVLTPELIHTHKMQDPVVWLTDKEKLEYCAGLDPAFTTNGDDCIMKVGAVGISADRIRTFAFVDTVRIPIDASSSRPATYQVVDGARVVLEKYNISVNLLAVDDSGTQSVADVIATEIGPGVQRVNNAQSATDDPLSPTDPTPASKKYMDRGTELWIRLALLGRQGALRGLTDRAANEFCIRRLVMAGKHKRLERKVEFKARLKGHRSPDDGDASALCVFAGRGLVGSSPALAGSHGPGYPLSGLSTGRPRIVNSIKSGNYVDVDGWNALRSYVGTNNT